MSEPTLDTLAQRLERAERENRALRRVGVLVLIGIAALVVGAQAAGSRVVEAEKLVVRDAGGKIRAKMGAPPDGRVALTLFDRDGGLRVELRVLTDGRVGLLLHDKDGKSRAALRALAEGRPVLGLFDKDEKLLGRRHRDEGLRPEIGTGHILDCG